MKAYNKFKIGNLLKIKKTFWDFDNQFYIGLIVNINNSAITIYYMNNNKPNIKEYSKKELSNISKLLSAKPWKKKIS